MADNRRFIQLSHPGSEATRVCGEAWHSTADGHQRKFMQFNGRWTAENGDKHRDQLWAWGEWEAQSELLRGLDCPGGPELPISLWSPFYAVTDDCRELHNTDPFIFGERFLYSNCQQWGTRRNGLRCLDRGSVIAFGSRVSREWVLDTVLVVEDFIDYEAKDVRSMLADSTPEAFLEVTGAPIRTGTGRSGSTGARRQTLRWMRCTASSPRFEPMVTPDSQGRASVFRAGISARTSSMRRGRR